jgi:hypothetical protein
MTNQRH